MQNELKRCNYLGNLESLYAFSKIAIVNYPTDIDSIKSISALNSKISVKVIPAVQFLNELKLIKLDGSLISATEQGLSIVEEALESFKKRLGEITLKYLLEEHIISADSVTYDPNEGVCRIKRSGFPFSVAAFRNFLLDIDAIRENEPGIFDVQIEYEMIFETELRNRKRKISLEELIEQQKRQEQQGRLAEEFVVEFERKRLLWSQNSASVKQISDFDVTAGYDIVSFNDKNSIKYDRYIEVKSFHSTPSFFWSSNELRVAKKYGGSYYLYLVDIDEYLTSNYEPIIVQNPAKTLLGNDEWICENSSIKITHI